MTIFRKATIFSIIILLFFLVIQYFLSPKLKNNIPNTKNASVLKSSMKINKFSLIDTDDKIFTEKSLKGHWNLLFFGYTGCPDVCPMTLSIIKEAFNSLPENKIPARFIFANINKKVTETSDIKKYLHQFHHRFIGINGADNDMQNLSKQLGVFANDNKLENKIDHTSAIFVIDPQARLRGIISPPFDSKIILHDLALLQS